MSNPLRDVVPSPRVKLALRLYASGALNKKDASRAAGLNENYLSMLTRDNGGSDHAKKMLEELDGQMLDSTLDMAQTVKRLGRLVFGRVANLALNGGSEGIQLAAAKEILNRSPETANITKLEGAVNHSMSLGNADAKAIAEALVESARLKTIYSDVIKDGLVEVDMTQGAENVPLAQIPNLTKSEEALSRQDSEANAEPHIPESGSAYSVTPSANAPTPSVRLSLVKGDLP